jgi:hypothetical protein
MDCTFDGNTCTRCGCQTLRPDLPRNCRPGLGDRVHAGLAAVGITPDRVAAALGVENCGCEERRATLNEWGYAIGIGTPTGPTG